MMFRNTSMDLDRPRVMGILNVTPDSFSDGGRFMSIDRALAQASRMVADGADLIDVGGESTRPGAEAVGLDEELSRVVPVIERLSGLVEVPISVDTSKPEVMRAAVAAGASMVNDVTALTASGAIATVADLGVPVCLMHMQGDPRSMQRAPSYTDVVNEVCSYLSDRIDACVAGGIARDRVIVDPGFGFGKQLQHNLALLRDLRVLGRLGVPILVGLSRKSMLGAVTGRDLQSRLPAGLAAAVLAVDRGARMVRVHDVAATVDAIRLWAAMQCA